MTREFVRATDRGIDIIRPDGSVPRALILRRTAVLCLPHRCLLISVYVER